MLAMAVATGNDAFMERLLDILLDESLYNVRIVNDGEENDDNLALGRA